MGYANSGRLMNPARLEEDEALRYVPGRPLHYGTDELIGLIHRAARTVYRHYHTRLSVGDLSAAGGGPVGHHASHQSGRDADVSFYVVDAHGEPVMMEDYLSFRRDGVPFTGGPLRFDPARNWALIEALLGDPSVNVEHVFVSNGLRSLLVHYARSHGADPALVARAENTLVQPPRGSPHTNHFHVRIACPAGDESCMDGVRHPPRHGRHPRTVAGNTTPHEHHTHEHHSIDRARPEDHAAARAHALAPSEPVSGSSAAP
jgi:penicillin-insensitive murein endopeptidase